jgi:hypothetical protein
MSLKLKNILTESIIDGLNMGKFEKGVLKMIHSVQSEYGIDKSGFSSGDAELISYISETISFYDYGKLIQIYKFYKKYSDILFTDSKFEEELNNEIKYPEDEKMVKFILLLFYYKNYSDQVLNTDRSQWKFTVTSGMIEESLSEEMFNMELWLMGDESPSVTIFCDLLPDEKGLLCDMITFDDDFATYNAEIKGSGTYEEVLGSVYLNIEKPKDLKEETLKLYFENIIKKVKTELIEKNNWKIESFIEDND